MKHKKRTKFQNKLKNRLTLFVNYDTIEVLPENRLYPILAQLQRRGYINQSSFGETIIYTLTNRGRFALTNFMLAQLSV